MSIVGGLDIHRRQVTFDYVDTETGRVRGGLIAPADRDQPCGGGGPSGSAVVTMSRSRWRLVRGGGMWPRNLSLRGRGRIWGEPADTSAKRGPKRRAKTDRADAGLMRDLLLKADLPECWNPPAIMVDCRAILELYRDLPVAARGGLFPK